MIHRLQNAKFIIGIAVIPLIIFAVVSLITASRAQYRDADALVHAQTENLAKDLGALLASRVSALDQAGLSYVELSTDQRVRDQIVSRFIASHDEVADMVIVDGKGKEVSHKSSSDPGRIALTDRSENIEFLTVKEKGYYFGPLYISQDKPVFLIGRAIPSSDKQGMRGAIFALMDGGMLQDALKEARDATGSNAFIVNEKGRIVAHPNISYIIEGKDFSHNIAVRLAMNDTGLFAQRYSNESGEHVVGAGVALAIPVSTDIQLAPNWYMVTETPASLVYASASHQRTISLIVLLFVLAVAGMGAFAVSRRMIAPVEEIDHAIVQLNQGNLAYRMHATDDLVWGNIMTGLNNFADRLTRISGELEEERNMIVSERRKLKLALSGITDAVIACDKKGAIMLTNKTAEELMGFAANKTMGKHIDEVVRLFENNKEVSMSDCFALAHENGLAYVGGANGLRLITAGNEQRFVSARIGTLQEEPDHHGGYLLTFHDITHERFLEKVKADFVAIAAHQLRTPLSEVKWSMEVLMGKELGAVTRKQKSFLKRSYESNERMIRLVDDLLETARVEERQLRYDKTPHDLKKIVDQMVAIHEKKAVKSGLKIMVKKLRGKLPLVLVDDVAIKIVFKNLLENAINYTPSGGMVTVALAKNDSGVQVNIIDTGIGIAPEDKEYLFTKFFRGKNAVKLETDGTGLGLYISKKIIDAHDGSMSVSSDLGHGSTFGFEIPFEV